MYCEGNSGQDFNIDELGGAGTIMTLDSLEDTAFTPLIPATYALPKDGKKIALYINSTKYEFDSSVNFIIPLYIFIYRFIPNLGLHYTSSYIDVYLTMVSQCENLIPIDQFISIFKYFVLKRRWYKLC